MIPRAHLEGYPVRDMKTGEQRNFNHRQCPAGPDHRGRLSVLRKTSNLWLVYCYNCGDGNALFEKGTEVDKTDVLEMLTKHLKPDEEVCPDTMVNVSRTGDLPVDVTQDATKWDAWAHERLWKHHTNASVVVRPPYCWTFSPSLNQFIIPIITGEDEVLGYQARQHPDRKPKCITTYFQGNNGKPLSYHFPDSHDLFIVEDPLSAVRLHAECHVNVMSLLGTHLGDPTLSALLHFVSRHRIERIFIWLDKDQAGREAASKIYTRLKRLYDPKRVEIQITPLLEPKQIIDLRSKVKEWTSPF